MQPNPLTPLIADITQRIERIGESSVALAHSVRTKLAQTAAPSPDIEKDAARWRWLAGKTGLEVMRDDDGYWIESRGYLKGARAATMDLAAFIDDEIARDAAKEVIP